MHPSQPTIIALTGMPGAGKSTFAKAACPQLGVPSWYIGQPLLEECSRRELQPTYANRMDMGHRLGLFDEADPLKFIAHSYAAMRTTYPHPLLVIFDSVRSPGELEFLKSKNGSVILVAILMGQGERFRRLAKRDSLPLEFVQSRDQMESGIAAANPRKLSVGQLIAIADHYIVPANGCCSSSGIGKFFPSLNTIETETK
jgi:dephospho-CoA kinase